MKFKELFQIILRWKGKKVISIEAYCILLFLATAINTVILVLKQFKLIFHKT